MRRRLGVIGAPIAHSLSPIMQRAALDALGHHDVSYEAIEVDASALEARLFELGREGFVGLNVTLPHKTRVMSFLDSVDDTARTIGAVNTLVRDGEGWIGTNTDALGLRRALEEAAVHLENRRVIVLGAGGAARASVVALDAAQEVIVVARRVEAALDVARLHRRGRATTFGDEAAFTDVDLVIQATSATLGAHAETFAHSIPLGRLCRDAVVVDLVYRPRETALLSRARADGLSVIDGTSMLVHQGAASLERWIGERPPIEIMRDAVLSALR